jgi:NADH dehydrogenase
MPVVVTGASGFVGRHAVRAFVRVSPEVRAYIRRTESAADLRDLGAKVAVGWIGDVENLAAVMDGAHTVCHLIGGLVHRDDRSLEDAMLGALGPVLKAAGMAGVRRLLFLSYPRASPQAANQILRLAGRAEEAIRAGVPEYVVVRSTWIYGSGSALSGLAAGRAGSQMWAPVLVEDVVAVLVAADDREAVRSGIWSLEGPDRVTAGEFLGALGGRRPWWQGFRGPARADRAGQAPLPAVADLLAMDSLADGPDAAAEFGVIRTPLAEGLRRSRAAG